VPQRSASFGVAGSRLPASDKLYRITNADYPGADETDYTYDAVGNRKTMVTGAGTTQYACDAADRLTSVTPPGQSAVSYGWDDNGNLTDRGSDDPTGTPRTASRQRR
jgi:YD repeat-containing protein